MSKSSSTTTKPSKFAKPYISAAANASQNAYNTNQGQIQNATNSVVNLLPSMIEKYQAGNPAVNAAQSYITDTLGSDYSQNPYLDQVLANSNNDIKNQMQAALGLKGLTGGSNYAGLISDKIAQNTLNTRYTDYNNWQNMRANAAGLAPSISAADVIQVAPMLSTLQASTTPIEAAGGYANSIGGLLGQYTTQKQSSGGLGSILGTLANAGAQIGSAAILASERRVKRDIEKIGEEHDGLGVYHYNYVWDVADEPVRTGVMVDEVEKLRPWALGPVINGIQHVDYGRL